MADISVIIPLYNKETTIERTVKSVLLQTYQDFELLIVDDGSTDRSMTIVQSFDDGRIWVASQENRGPGAARNTGVRYAKTDWIVFLDADDELLPDALAHFVTLREVNSTIDIFDCSTIIRHDGKEKTRKNPIEGEISNNLKACFFGAIGPGSGHAMFRKTVLEQFQYDEKLRRFEDAELIVRMLPHVKVYSSRKSTFIVNSDFSSASARRKDIAEDYAGHLSFKGKSFWGKMCVYRCYLENRNLYPEEMQRLYPSWYYRYDLLLLFKLLHKLYK